MGTETSSTGHDVIVEYPQCSEMHLLGIVPSGKTETVVGVQPAVVGMATLISAMKYELCLCFCGDTHGMGRTENEGQQNTVGRDEETGEWRSHHESEHISIPRVSSRTAAALPSC